MAQVHDVKQGECLSSIARRFGFRDWKKIYQHPMNADLRQKRPNPNVLHPGDRIFIPAKETKVVARETEKTHPFRLKPSVTRLHLVLEDEAGRPRAGRRYKLLVDNKGFEGETKPDGSIQHVIFAESRQGELLAWLDDPPAERPSHRFVLKLGHLDPIEEITGVQARLNNLGFDCGPVDGRAGPMTRAAVRAFQEKHRLAVDGIPGPATKAKLVELHGC